MNYPGAIVIAAGLISGALLLSSQVSSQSAIAIGRYQFGGTSADGKEAWRVHTSTGEMAHCTYQSGPKVTCVPGGRPPQ
jgi:hypothetical protein